MLFLSLSVIIFSIKLTTQAHLCQPYITEGSHSKKELGGYLYLDCDISTCENVSKVIFEKTDAHQITQWTPVFEGKDTSHNTVLDTDDDYSLKGRNDYVVFPTFHSLYITNITLKDTGWWRCVLLQNNKRTESKATDIYLAPLCTPVITEGSHSKKELRGHLYLECDISSCKRVSRVVFEKNGVQQPAQWTPVFEGIDESHYTALDTCEDYTLKQRNNYFSFPTYHLLYIGNLTMNDFGEWRCVSNQNHRRAESKHIRIVMIDGSHVTITHANPFVVAKQDETFTCTIDEIHTEPIFEWTVTSLSSSEKYYGETIISKQRDDGLWYASNVVKLKLNNHGQPALKCSLVTKNKVPLMETQLTVDIKAPAKITDPTEEQLISKNVSSTLTLRCGGSGYRPLITWQQNGLDIQDKNPQFHLTRSCSTSFCTSTLTLKPIAPPLSCDNVVANSLEYTCTVILKPPYTSNDTSKPIKVEIMYPPLIKDSSKDDDTIDSLTVILRCEVCSSTNSTSEWTYNGKILQGDNIEYQQDGSVKLIGNHPSGTYTRTVRNSVGYINCVVQYRNRDNVWKLLILLACLLLVLIVITIFIRVLVRGRLKIFNYSLIREEQGFLLHRAPRRTKRLATRLMAHNMRSIWRTNDSDHVFLGGQDSPSITVIDNAGENTNYQFKTGTRILNGIFLFNKIHIVNVYDTISSTSAINCVCIDLRSIDQNLTPQSTLNLSDECSTPGCIFRVDNSHVGVYSFNNRIVEVFDMSADGGDNNDDKTEMKALNPSLQGEIIKLTGYTAHECDMLSTSENGQICVTSFTYNDVYVYARTGEFMKRVTGGLVYNPVHIQCFNDRTMAVLDRVGQIYRFDKKKSNIIIKLGGNTIVKAAVFTKTKLWIIDGNDSSMIHTFKLN